MQSENAVDPAGAPQSDASGKDAGNYKAKLTVATIGGAPERAKTEKTRVGVATFIGIATGTKMVENQNEPEKPYVAVTGNFEAVNLYTGEIYRSGILYLPTGLHDLVVNMLDQVKGDEDRSKFDKAAVEFALQIDAEPADNAAGYQYVGKSLLPPQKADALSHLRALTAGIVPVKQLPPPAPQAQIAA